MSATSRRKGARGEREIAKLISEALGIECKRGLGQARSGKDVADVVGLKGFRLEVKTQKKANVRAALRQAEADAAAGEIPVAIIRDDRQPPFVALDLTHWLDLVRAALRTPAAPIEPRHRPAPAAVDEEQ